MSIEEFTAAFGWGPEAAEALGRAERAIETLCRPETGFRPAPSGLNVALDEDVGRSLYSVVDEICQVLESSGYAARHPRSLAHMVPPPATVAVIGDLLKGAANQCAFTVQQGPLAPALEAAVLHWVGAAFGFDKSSGGLLTSGATISNYAAAYLALDRARRTSGSKAMPCIVASDQAHFSIVKAARLIGIGERAVFKAPTGANGRMEPASIAKQVRLAAFKGYQPFLFVCTAGTTNAGILEPIEPFAEAASKSGAWLHIDGAHGGFRALASDQQHYDWACADSVAWDPHKSLFVTYPSGILILRDPDAARAFVHQADYAFQRNGDRDPAFAHFEGSRGLDALKIWMTIRHFGAAGLRQIADHLLDLSDYLARQIVADPRFELVASPDTNLICFRWVAASADVADAVNEAIQEELYEQGHSLLSRTRIGSRSVLRAVIQNPLTKREDLDMLLADVAAAAEIHAEGCDITECRQTKSA